MREEIIRMARECGWDDHNSQFDIRIERFFHMAQAAERERLKSAAECFRMCEHKGVCNEKAKSNETN